MMLILLLLIFVLSIISSWFFVPEGSFDSLTARIYVVRMAGTVLSVWALYFIFNAKIVFKRDSIVFYNFTDKVFFTSFEINHSDITSIDIEYNKKNGRIFGAELAVAGYEKKFKIITLFYFRKKKMTESIMEIAQILKDRISGYSCIRVDYNEKAIEKVLQIVKVFSLISFIFAILVCFANKDLWWISVFVIALYFLIFLFAGKGKFWLIDDKGIVFRSHKKIIYQIKWSDVVSMEQAYSHKQKYRNGKPCAQEKGYSITVKEQKNKIFIPANEQVEGFFRHLNK